MICFHHNDPDGKCAGAIIAHWSEGRPYSLQFVELDYGWPIDLSIVKKDEEIYIVDFHFPAEIMKELCEITPFVYVFDHHKTSKLIMDQYPEVVSCYWCGDNEWAGCELVWNYLFPNKDVPDAVRLIADRDKWAWKYGEETAKFNAGLTLYPHQPTDMIWEDLLDTSSVPYGTTFSDRRVLLICKEGKICLKYRDMMCKEFRNSWGYKVNFANYLCYVMNLKLLGVGSEMFAEKLEEYDICIGVVFSGSSWTISLRSDGKVDVSKIAERYGKKYGTSGGGHKKAAGFLAPELPFKIVE